MIKQVVQKQMTKRPRKRVVEQIVDEDDNEDEDEYEYEPPKPQHRRNERAFSPELHRSESIAIKNDVVAESPPQQVFRSRIRR